MEINNSESSKTPVRKKSAGFWSRFFCWENKNGSFTIRCGWSPEGIPPEHFIDTSDGTGNEWSRENSSTAISGTSSQSVKKRKNKNKDDDDSSHNQMPKLMWLIRSEPDYQLNSNRPYSRAHYNRCRRRVMNNRKLIDWNGI